MTNGKPGRPKLTEEEKAQNKAWKDAGLDPKTERAKLKAETAPAVVEPSEDDRFAITRQHEPIIAEAEQRAREAAEHLKATKSDYAKAYGGKVKESSDALSRFRLLQTDQGRARLRADVEAFARIREWEQQPVGHMGDLLESLSDTKAIEHRPEAERIAA